jgi:DNA-binding CsgD family transcriptional regulator
LLERPRRCWPSGIEILGLIAQRLTNREIAERIYLSVRTVEWHRSRLAVKLGTSSRAELVAMARRVLPE